MGSILYMHELPPVGGDTLFASMYAAYDTLSDTMKRFLEPLSAMHEGEHVYRGRYGAKEDGRRQYPKAEHPVIRTHPVSGRKALFVNRGFTTRIVQLKKTESAAVLELLFRHVETPELHCRFRWQPLGGLLGQPRRPAPRDVGLLPAAAARAPRHDQGRQAVLPSLTGW